MATLGMDVGGILLTWLHDYMGGNLIGRDGIMCKVLTLTFTGDWNHVYSFTCRGSYRECVVVDTRIVKVLGNKYACDELNTR